MLSVTCVCHVRALTFDSLDLETFWYAGTSPEYLGHIRISRSSHQGQGQGHSSEKRHTHIRGWPAFD